MTIASATDLRTLEEQLFADVSGYNLASAGRIRLGVDGNSIFTYGEVSPEAIQVIIEKTEARPGEVFCDLGSGTGKAVILAAAMHPFAKSVGIDLLYELTEAANQVASRYHEQVRPQLGDSWANQEVEFLTGDIFATDWRQSDVVFSHCTCFDEDLMQRLTNSCLHLKPGSRVVTVTKGLRSDEFELYHSQPQRMGWGDATMFFYRRK
jgi:SAM-dependent methyltransferase